MSEESPNLPDFIPPTPTKPDKPKKEKTIPELPKNLAKGWPDCVVPDFSDPNRPKTCLEVDFPIAQINALSQLEGNAGKPIYQMSKWWARRRSSVFRSLLISAATQCPEDPSEAAKIVWEHYYCNHQKNKKFSAIKVLEPFMGGGTTLVEGTRLGMKMTGIDLNPVAWFVSKNELAGSDPREVAKLFAEIEETVKPQIQPFYATTCPRGHKGRWIDIRTNEEAAVDPVSMPPGERACYRWEGPEIIYTFWAKHAPCSAHGCNHRTPLFKNTIVAQKRFSVQYIELTCPSCGQKFHAELGETRMAPAADFLSTDTDSLPFTAISQPFANTISNYDKGTQNEKNARWQELTDSLKHETGLSCPNCHAFAGDAVRIVLDSHLRKKPSQRKKKDFNIQKKNVSHWLVISPDWLKGSPSCDQEDNEYGGYAGASPEITAKWNEERLQNLSLVEIRSPNEPDSFFWHGEMHSVKGTIPEKGKFTCSHCGKNAKIFETIKTSPHVASFSPYTYQCHCPQCEAEGYNYNGRYFKVPDERDIQVLNAAEYEWANRSNKDLSPFWPRREIAYSMRTHVRDSIDQWGYTHWWKMFNSRQLLTHAQLLCHITNAIDRFPVDVCEQALGAFQQYLRNQNMFSFWNIAADKLEPALSNSNFHPKNNVLENSFIGKLGRGNWNSTADKIIEGLAWATLPWEAFVTQSGSEHLKTDDPVLGGSSVLCGSSADPSLITENDYDLIITDPPFGNNIYYADLSEFFYCWLRIPMLKWHEGEPEADFFKRETTPHSAEAIDNPVEYPDDREDFEKQQFITKAILEKVRQESENPLLREKDANPCFRPLPSGEFYSRILSDCWSEASRHLKPGGLMAFTFHHNDDNAWIDVLRALFDAGFYLVATYPVRSDETKGENAAFGSQRIEYDVVHVCRKRMENVEMASYAKMRKFVREEVGRLKSLLETVHGSDLPEADLRVILRGKSLEFYSQHYGAVQTGTGEILGVRDALIGINQMLDDVLTDSAASGGLRPPENAEPTTRLFLRIFKNVSVMSRDTLHKTLQGSGVSQSDLESRSWISVRGREVTPTSIRTNYARLTRHGMHRKNIKTDLDQAYFLMGTIFAQRNLLRELENEGLTIKDSVSDILNWFSTTSNDSRVQNAASVALSLLTRFQNHHQNPESTQETFDFMNEEMR